MVSLAYWAHVVLALPYLAVLATVALWMGGRWMRIESVDEPIDHMALTIAGIPVEEIWPDITELDKVLRVDTEHELARLVAARLRTL